MGTLTPQHKVGVPLLTWAWARSWGVGRSWTRVCTLLELPDASLSFLSCCGIRPSAGTFSIVTGPPAGRSRRGAVAHCGPVTASSRHTPRRLAWEPLLFVWPLLPLGSRWPSARPPPCQPFLPKSHSSSPPDQAFPSQDVPSPLRAESGHPAWPWCRAVPLAAGHGLS